MWKAIGINAETNMLCTDALLIDIPNKFQQTKIVSVINVSVLCGNITKLSFVCMCVKFDFSYLKTR